MPEFAHPLLLLLLLPLLVGLVWRALSPPPAIAVSSVDLYRPEAKGTGGARLRRNLPLLIEGLAAAAFIVALARPQQALEVAPITREGTEIVVALDYSNSMDASDPGEGVSPWEAEQMIQEGTLIDRLEVAREQITRFVKRRTGDRIGLVIFGHRPFTACPPTLDHDFLVAQVDQLSNSLLGGHERGTNIGGGLATAVGALADLEEERRTIVLITDGENTITDPVFSPAEAAEFAAEKDITVHTVGIGSNSPYIPPHLRGSMFPDESYNTDTLSEIADITGGRFFRPMDNAGFEAVMDIIDQMETTSRVHPAVIYRRDLFPPVVATGAALLLLSFVLRRSLLCQIA